MPPTNLPEGTLVWMRAADNCRHHEFYVIKLAREDLQFGECAWGCEGKTRIHPGTKVMNGNETYGLRMALAESWSGASQHLNNAIEVAMLSTGPALDQALASTMAALLRISRFAESQRVARQAA